MQNETLNKIIEANKVLTLKDARKLIGKLIGISWKDANGNFVDIVDRITVMDVAKVKESKTHLLMDSSNMYSYHCVDGKNFVYPTTGAVVYYIEF
jgi:hypothetical protein